MNKQIVEFNAQSNYSYMNVDNCKNLHEENNLYSLKTIKNKSIMSKSYNFLIKVYANVIMKAIK